MSNKILFNPQDKLLAGVNKVADAVEITLGARGNNVGIDKINHKGEIFERVVVHDGVTVAKSIQLKDEAENFGAQILIEAAKRQVDLVGDGTTATISLARAILKEAHPIVAAGINAQEIKPLIEKGVKKVVDQIKKTSKKTKTVDDLIRVATISCEDKELGELIARTVHKVGVDGVVTAEESRSPHTTVDHQTGMQLAQGMYHEFFITNPDRMEAVLEHPYVLVTDKPIESLVPLAPFLNEFVKSAKKLVIISPEISPVALGLFIQNKIEGKMLPLCIKAPLFGEPQNQLLQDIAILTGAKFISEVAGHQFEEVKMTDLGRTQNVTATKTETIITGGMGSKKAIAERVALIKAALDKNDKQNLSDFERVKIEERLGKLTSGVAVIHVGGYTEIEMKERRERVIDGIAATKAAMREGIVPGGEIVYLQARDVLDQDVVAERILYIALERPFRRLVENAGYDSGQMLERLKENKMGLGIDVVDGEVKNMIEVGIIDPTAVPVNALNNACSVALVILTTKAIIIPEEDDHGREKM